MEKKTKRLRRALRTRAKIKDLAEIRLSVHRTPRHIYAQLIAPAGDKIIACASTLDKDLRTKVTNSGSGNVTAAKEVGALIAKRGIAAGVKKVAFDRSGLRYHGRVKALAEAAREGGIEF